MINSHKVTKHACTSSWLPPAHSKHHTYHQVTVMNKQQKKQRLQTTHIYIHISCKCDTNRVGHFTLDAHASRPVACLNKSSWPRYYWRIDGKVQIVKSCLCGRMSSRSEYPWSRHQMEIFSSLLALCAGNSLVTGEFPAQRPVGRSIDVFFALCLNKRLSKQSWGWWSETPSRSLWLHCNAYEFDSLAPATCISNFIYVISEHMLRIEFMSISCEIALRWKPKNICGDNSTLCW